MQLLFYMQPQLETTRPVLILTSTRKVRMHQCFLLFSRSGLVHINHNTKHPPSRALATLGIFEGSVPAACKSHHHHHHHHHHHVVIIIIVARWGWTQACAGAFVCVRESMLNMFLSPLLVVALDWPNCLSLLNSNLFFLCLH